MTLTLRPATMADAALLFNWRNDPEVLIASGNTSPVTIVEHHLWMKPLVDEDGHQHRWLYIAEIDGVPAGTGRIEERTNRRRYWWKVAALHYSLAAEWRGKGLGKELVKALKAEAVQLGFNELVAQVRRENIRSAVCAIMAGVNSVEVL